MTTPKISQRVQVFNHLNTHGYITDVVAQSYGIRRLASRIEELKRNNVAINVETRRDDLGRRYAYYTLGCYKNCAYCAEAAAHTPRRAA